VDPINRTAAPAVKWKSSNDISDAGPVLPQWLVNTGMSFVPVRILAAVDHCREYWRYSLQALFSFSQAKEVRPSRPDRRPV
jgi:hypothetical protein